ncbi:hypothetical protein [Streptomyces sp. NPDC002676]
MAEIGELLATVCRELGGGGLRAIAVDAGAAEPLDRILAELRGDVGQERLAAALLELHAALIRYGVAGGLAPTVRRQYRASPASSAGSLPTIEVWACPAGRCSRWHAVADALDEPPTCEVTGTALTRKHIRW